MMQPRYPKGGPNYVSTTGTQRNSNIHGSATSVVSAVISATGTPAARNFVGTTHQIYPIGAPSLKYNAANKKQRPGLVVRRFGI